MTAGADLRRMLVVEDSESDLALLQEALAEGQVDVQLDVVHHGEDALAFLHRDDPFADAQAPDLMVLDLNLPRLGGFEVLQALRDDGDARLRRLPVVVFTTSSSIDDVDRAYDLRASSFMTKPAAFGHYVETVRAFREFWLRVARLPSGA